MNIYYDNFSKYRDYVSNFDGDSYIDLVEDVQRLVVPKVGDDDEKHAIVMHGFSGNGKSTWIKNFCLEHPEYVVLSMDTVVRKRQEELGRRIEGMEITEAFSKAFDEACSSSKKIIVDGNFLNLLTRMALVDSFHMNGYSVSLVDITPIFDITIERRIMDEASRVFGVRITDENVGLVRNHPTYKQVEAHVRSFHEQERASANYNEQRLVLGTSIGVEEVVVVGNGEKCDGVGGKKL